MKKDKLFDVIVYRFLLSIPVSCVANFVYGFMLLLALWAWSSPFGSSLKNFEQKIIVFSVSMTATIPFILFNIVRYIAVKSGHLRYGVKAWFLSFVPEYLLLILLLYIYDLLS